MKIPIPAVLIFLATFCIYGCATNYPVDLNLVSVSKIKRSDISEVVGDDENLPIIEYWTSSDFLKVDVSTKEDLAYYANKTDSTLNVGAYFCDSPEKVVLLGLSSIYMEGVRVSGMAGLEGIDASKENLFVYDLVLFVTWDKERDLPGALKKDKDQLVYLQFDLEKDPLDICLSVGGGNMTNSYRSNVIRISRNQIKTAL